MEFVVLRFIRMKNKFPVINFPTRCFDFSTDLSCLALIVAPTCELLRTQRINIAAASLMNLVTVAIHELKCCNENCNTYNTLYFDRDFDIPSLVISKNIFLHSSEERERERDLIYRTEIFYLKNCYLSLIITEPLEQNARRWEINGKIGLKIRKNGG